MGISKTISGNDITKGQSRFSLQGRLVQKSVVCPFGQSGLNNVQPLHYLKWLLDRFIASCSSGLSHVDSSGMPGAAGTGPSGLLGAGLTKSTLACYSFSASCHKLYAISNSPFFSTIRHLSLFSNAIIPMNGGVNLKNTRKLFTPVNENAEEGLVFFKTAKKKQAYDALKDFLFDKEEVVFAYVYGSFSSNDCFRDIDIAVFLEPLPSNPLSYELEMSSELELAFGVPVDVRVINAAPLDFAAEAIRGTLLFSRDEDKRVDFELEVLRNALDRLSTIEYLRP